VLTNDARSRLSNFLANIRVGTATDLKVKVTLPMYGKQEHMQGNKNETEQ